MKNKKVLIAIGFLVTILALGSLAYFIIKNTQATQPEINSPVEQLPTFEPINPTISNLDAALVLVDPQRIYNTLEHLTSIEAHSGWRGSGTSGEKQALDYMQSRVQDLSWLSNLGMTLEREEFEVFLSTEDHTTSVFLSDGTQMLEIPAGGIRGSRDDRTVAMSWDSDGKLNDLQNDPVTAEGEVIVVPDENVLSSLTQDIVSGKIMMVDYSIVDTLNEQAMVSAQKVLDLDPSAIILVTRFSDEVGGSHGAFSGESGGVFQKLSFEKTIPILVIQMENLVPFSIEDWDGISTLTRARVIWDTDVSNPGKSGNLIVHIPGKNPDKPILLSAHIDSPNSPGALDNGTGSAILLEVATILNELEIQPEVDLFLAWYGSEELGLYGSTHFTTTHSDLMNQLQANMQIDSLTNPLEGLPAQITMTFDMLVTPNFSRSPLLNFMLAQAEIMQIEVNKTYSPLSSDNGSLTAFNIPNFNLIYESEEMINLPGGIWVAGHFHSPYDTVERVKEMEPVLVDMVNLALAYALCPANEAQFVEHTTDKVAVFLANHTQSPHLTPAAMQQFTLELIRSGYRIDIVPYGKPVEASNLKGAELVVILPAYDFALDENPIGIAPGWTQSEAVVIDEYVKDGGKILVLNTARRQRFYSFYWDENEDWAALNTLTGQWGITFSGLGIISSRLSTTKIGVAAGMSNLILNPDSAVYFNSPASEVLVGSPSRAYLSQLNIGNGQVVILGDFGALGDTMEGPANPQLFMNIANWE